MCLLLLDTRTEIIINYLTEKNQKKLHNQNKDFVVLFVHLMTIYRNHTS